MERQDAMASTLVVIAGSGYNAQRRQDNTVLHTERDPTVIGRVADLLATRGGESHAWMEWPRVSLVFLDGRAVIAEYGVLGGARWVRTSLDGDREIEKSAELGAWLVEVGAPVGISPPGSDGAPL